MIIEINECAFSSGVDPALSSALESSINAFKQGFHALIVTPQAMDLVENSALGEHLKEGLRLAHGFWTEGQGLRSKASRVISITGDIAQDGLLDGSSYHVYKGSLDDHGIFREPSFVAEALAADAKYIKVLLSLNLGLDEAALRRLWRARPEQGGGGATHAYVERYIAGPTPVVIVCDHDGPASEPCGATADRCLKEVVDLGIYSTRELARAGGYADQRPNFGVRILGCHELENLILPNMAQVLFLEAMNDRAGRDRQELMVKLFPAFPNLDAEGARLWLDTDFKEIPDFGQALNSRSLSTLSDWFNENDANARSLRAAYKRDMSSAVFRAACDAVVTDVWTVGARFGDLR